MKTTPHPQRWAWHEAELLRLRTQLLGESTERSAASRTPVERGGTDPIDRATEESEHGELLAEWALEEMELAEIDAALQRIRDGTYGLCAATGRPIEPARLKAVPWTRWSAAAAAQREPRHRSAGTGRATD